MKYPYVFSLSLLPLTAMAQSGQPNIVFFMVDDMGWQDTSVPFWTERTALNNLFETPNMERLAASGMKFTQAYACSVSSPSRISLFTGMNAARHRVTNWTLRYNQSTDGNSNVLDYPQWNVNGMCCQTGVPNTVYATSLAQILKDNGYYTIHCGKAHWGAISTPAADPHTLGFDVNIAGYAAGGLASYLGERNYGNTDDPSKQSPFAIPGLEKYHGTHTFVTEALTLEALNALNERDKQKPFFLYMSHYAVHIPLDRDQRYYTKYIEKGLDAREAAYAALVEGMDKSLGDLMDYLEREKLTEQTIIIFMSDNGGLSAQERGRAAHTHNRPLRSGKGSIYEGGVREPLIIKWPGVVKAASACSHYVMIEDFYPTLLDMAGVKRYKTVQDIDGQTMLPLLMGKETGSKKRCLYWNFPNNWGPKGPGIGATAAIRQGDWKLIYYYEDGKKELFNIREDISEEVECAAQYPGLVRKLSNELGRYLKKVDAQRPSFKATGKVVPWPDEV